MGGGLCAVSQVQPGKSGGSSSSNEAIHTNALAALRTHALGE
jgi:hypothetical protein